MDARVVQGFLAMVPPTVTHNDLADVASEAADALRGFIGAADDNND